MKIIDQFQKTPLENTIVTSGTFDGVHFGHRKILKKVVENAKKDNAKSVVITYWPHPRFVLGKDPQKLKLISTFDEKTKLIAESGIDYLFKINFTREFSQLTADQFVKSILLEKLNTKKIIIGYDHRFGRNQEGEIAYLEEHKNRFGFEVEEIPHQDIHDVTVSSTKIREALQEGEVHIANEYLGRHYSLCGLVTKGEQVGRKIGFPTANIYVPETYKLIPGDGVYAVKVKIDDNIYDGMLNIGNRPTVMGQKRTIEVNIFNFEQDIYGLKIEVDFVEQLRKEQKFENLELLKRQLEDDKKNAINILSKL